MPRLFLFKHLGEWNLHLLRRGTLWEEQFPDGSRRRSDAQICIRHPSGDVKLEVGHMTWSTRKYILEI